MFSFKKSIPTYDIGGIRIGGELGKNPTVLMGSMFYSGHRIVEDRSTGQFDRNRAETLINQQEELSDQTGLPGIECPSAEPILLRIFGATKGSLGG